MRRLPDIDSLFRQHRDELQRFAERRLGDRESARDIVQDAFLRVSATLDARADDAAAIENPRAFLFRVTGNLATDALRHGRVVGSVIIPGLDGETQPAP